MHLTGWPPAAALERAYDGILMAVFLEASEEEQDAPEENAVTDQESEKNAMTTFSILW